MINQYCTKNMASESNANTVSDSHLIVYANKSMELKVMEEVIAMYQDTFLEKTKILKEEKQKLDELNYQILSMENAFCEEVWRFSREHNFSAIFQYYPFVKETIHYSKQKDDYEDDIKRNSELIDLINEIDILKAEIFSLNNSENIKRDVENALTKLQKLQLISDDIIDLIRLISSPELISYNIPMISMPIHDEKLPNFVNKNKRYKKSSTREDLKTKKIYDIEKESSSRNKSQLQTNSIQSDKKLNSSFVNKRDVNIISESYPQLFLEKSIIFGATTVITNVPAKFTNSDDKKKSFILRKPSEISIKLKQNHEHK